MERLPKLDVRAYAAAMREEFEKTMRSVAEAVHQSSLWSKLWNVVLKMIN